MKPDERALLLAIYQNRSVYVREVIRLLGMNEKRAAYICQKWTAKGWYNYGVSVLAGWLEPAGIEAAAWLQTEGF